MRMTWTQLHAQIHRTIGDRKLFKSNESLLVAVSGGQDSLCLIKLLLDIQYKWGWKLAIAHCDHRWREDSQANADHVQSLAESWDIPFHLQVAEQQLNSEASARNWRYQVLTRVAQVHNFQYIVTRHTASDRAETLLYNLFRGTGTDGLQALGWQRQIAPEIMLVRPLLDVTRTATKRFCQEFNLPIWEDSTNENWQYARNRIRQELLPYLQKSFNPQVESNLAQTAEILQGDVAYLEEKACELRLKALGKSEDGNLQVNRRFIQKQPLALQRRVMRQLLLEILPDAPNFEHIEKITALITAPNRSQTDPFPGGAIAYVQGDWICFKS